jgi:phosphoribosylformylglycinamidine cyclo-ligase
VLSHIKALAHITGGGFIENIPRILPDDLDAKIQIGSWPVSPLWTLIQQRGEIDTNEMYRVFNMGIGMILIVDKNSVSKIQNLIPETTFVIGELVEGNQKVKFIN